MKVSTCLVDAYEDYNCFGEVSFFRPVEGFKMKQRAAINYCVELKKTATETFEMCIHIRWEFEQIYTIFFFRKFVHTAYDVPWFVK
jgi:hypothetical protein